MGHIFISYSHKDKDYVHKLQKALQNEGFEVWIDDRIDFGTTWPHVIQQRLDDCDAFIVVMTEDAYKSIWVQNEVTRARRKGKPFFALLLKGDTWLSLEAVQYENVAGGKLPSKEFYESIARKMQPSEKKDSQEIELENLESQAIQYELKGDFWNARKTWYEIKRIDPLFPRVDIKIGELEQEIEEKAIREKAKHDEIEKARREKIERQTAHKAALAKTISNFLVTLKSTLTKSKPILRVVGIIGIIIVLSWAGSWGVPKLIQLMPTAKASLTPTLHPSATLTFSPQPPTETVTPNPISTETKTPSPAPIWPIIGNWLIKYQFGCSGNTKQFTLDVRPNGVLFTSSGNEGTWVNYGNYVDMQISTTTIVRYTGKISEDTMSGTMYGINGCWNAQRIK